MFENLEDCERDPVLLVTEQYRSDPFTDKVDLGVGVYRDSRGGTPVLRSIRRAEQLVLEAQTTQSYVHPAGRREFSQAVQRLVLGANHTTVLAGQTVTIQAPGGAGALRIGAELIKAATPHASIHVSAPTWANHASLLGGCGLRIERYPYYQTSTNTLTWDPLVAALEAAKAGDAILIQACCHNPSGAELECWQWRLLSEIMNRRGLVPFIDLAYQGFGKGLFEDVANLRKVVESVDNALVAVTFSKNLGLYRERAGALILKSSSRRAAGVAGSRVLQIIRTLYCMPPDWGAALAECVLTNDELRHYWIDELESMRQRTDEMRHLLATQLREAGHSDRFDFILTQRGMFSLLGVPAAVVHRLRQNHHIYLSPDGRVNISGLTANTVPRVANAIIAELCS